MTTPTPTPAPGGDKKGFLQSHAVIIGFLAVLIFSGPIRSIIGSFQGGQGGDGGGIIAVIVIVAVFYGAFHRSPKKKDAPAA